MFNRKAKEKTTEKPLGVIISLDINTVTLGEIAAKAEPPTIQSMSSVWLNENCTKTCVDIAVINAVQNEVLFILGSDATIYRDADFNIRLPFPVGPNKTDVVSVTSTENLVLFSFDGIPIMGFPTTYIVNSLLGKPLAEYKNARKDLAGEEEEREIKVLSDSGDVYMLPLISKVAKNWFKYQNTAVKVKISPISSDDYEPITLRVKTE